MEFNYNTDIKTRDEIIFGEYDPKLYLGGVRYFTDMTLETIKMLVKTGFADPEDRQNEAPSIEEFISFMEANEGYVLGGYTVTDERSDYRISIDRIEKTEPIYTKEELEAFVDFARWADDFETDGYAWWD